MTHGQFVSGAAALLARIQSAIDAWYDGQIDYETFSLRQRATWDAIRAAGPRIEARVLRVLRAAHGAYRTAVICRRMETLS